MTVYLHRAASVRPTLYGLLALFAAIPAAAQPAAQTAAPDVTREVDALFDWATPATPGCAVAVSKDGVRVVDRAYGSADLARGVPLTPSTLFDAGSVVKQFVAAAVLLLVDDGRVALTDDVRMYIPELPDTGHEVTVDHLLTHTSGVRDWTGLQPLASDDADALTLVLRQHGLNFTPGDEWSYSNSGYVLLKELVARVSGISFSEFARQRLFGPLGMASTTYAVEPQQGHEALAVAYQMEDDRWVPGVLEGNERGGGGALLTTAGDLVRWNEALADARLGAFVTEALQQPARLNTGRALGYARGLFLDDVGGSPLVWHSGSAGAYKAVVARVPDHGFALAILCNAGDTRSPMRFAGPIRELFVPDVSDARQEARDAGAEGGDVDGRAGLFFSERAGDPLRLVAQRGRLRVEGGPALVAVAADRFRTPEGTLEFMSGDRVELHFLSPDALDLVTSDGQTTRYRRAHPAATTTAEMEAVAGRYESDELSAVLEVALGESGLTVRLNDSRPFELTPLEGDAYGLGRMTLRVRRDATGAAVAIDYSNPVLRHVAFTRTSGTVERQ